MNADARKPKPNPLPLALSVGDPAGVGPEIAVKAARRTETPLLLVGDEAWLRDHIIEPLPHLSFLDTGAWPQELIGAGREDPAAGEIQLRILDAAIDEVLGGRARGLVTGPVSKSAVSAATLPASGIAFRGQTEHLARRAGLSDDAVTMLFVGPRLKVALVTTHHAIRDVPEEITAARLERAHGALREVLLKLKITSPEIAICGLNPHAGEGGLLGEEELALHAQTGLVMTPAESALRRAAEGAVDGVVAMYHDQATIASKILDWGAAVNLTWGLPFVRTSVDHGVAYDIAGSWRADEGGLLAAIALADQLTAP